MPLMCMAVMLQLQVNPSGFALGGGGVYLELSVYRIVGIFREFHGFGASRKSFNRENSH